MQSQGDRAGSWDFRPHGASYFARFVLTAIGKPSCCSRGMHTKYETTGDTQFREIAYIL